MELLEHVIRNDDKTLTIKLDYGDFDILCKGIFNPEDF